RSLQLRSGPRPRRAPPRTRQSPRSEQVVSKCRKGDAAAPRSEDREKGSLRILPLYRAGEVRERDPDALRRLFEARPHGLKAWPARDLPRARTRIGRRKATKNDRPGSVPKIR